jgi:hypothetical protein
LEYCYEAYQARQEQPPRRWKCSSPRHRVLGGFDWLQDWPCIPSGPDFASGMIATHNQRRGGVLHLSGPLLFVFHITAVLFGGLPILLLASERDLQGVPSVTDHDWDVL